MKNSHLVGSFIFLNVVYLLFAAGLAFLAYSAITAIYENGGLKQVVNSMWCGQSGCEGEAVQNEQQVQRTNFWPGIQN